MYMFSELCVVGESSLFLFSFHHLPPQPHRTIADAHTLEQQHNVKRTAVSMNRDPRKSLKLFK